MASSPTRVVGTGRSRVLRLELVELEGFAAAGGGFMNWRAWHRALLVLPEKNVHSVHSFFGGGLGFLAIPQSLVCIICDMRQQLLGEGAGAVCKWVIEIGVQCQMVYVKQTPIML